MLQQEQQPTRPRTRSNRTKKKKTNRTNRTRTRTNRTNRTRTRTNSTRTRTNSTRTRTNKNKNKIQQEQEPTGTRTRTNKNKNKNQQEQEQEPTGRGRGRGLVSILTSGTDGSCVVDEVSGASFSGSGFSAHFSGQVWRSRRWGHLDDSGPVVCLNPVWVFALCLLLFRLFRELSFGSYLSLQATGVVHLEVDNLIVVRHVGGLILLVCWCSSHGT